jgi:metal-responsive CopG/Arc/MetJ family transcriptional regulator
VRTTVTLAKDVAAAVDRVRRERAIGVSEAINELIRTGLATPAKGRHYRQVTHDMGTAIDYSNIADVIETVDGPMAR